MNIETAVGLRRACVLACVVVSTATLAFAQEATLSGTVTDSTGSVLPGVTVSARHVATGNVSDGVTDGNGRFRLPARIGAYDLTFQLSGFATVTREGLNLQVGQTVDLTVQMAPAALQETVTVTGVAPLIDVTSSRLGGNIDVRQMQELPVNGRDWLALTALAPGARGGLNVSGGMPTVPDNGIVLGGYQMSIDGQRVNQSVSTGTYNAKSTSRDALGEFEYITSRFDASQGRAFGVQVNAVTKAGTNNFSGTASGYFRDDRFNAKDHVTQRRLPFSNQQVVGTFGGPVVRDKIHFFSYYEYERSPRTVLFQTPYPQFNIEFQSDPAVDKQGGGRVDVQLRSSMHLMARAHVWRNVTPPSGGGTTTHPSTLTVSTAKTNQFFSRLTSTFGSSALNELRGGYNPAHRLLEMLTACEEPGGLTALATPVGCRPPQILMAGLTLGTATNNPQDVNEEDYQIANTFSIVTGKHQIKTGVDYTFADIYLDFGQTRYGVIDAQGGPIPANVQDIFPVWNDWRTWNLAALSPITRSYQVSFGAKPIRSPRHIIALFAQDDWRISSALTLNLGIRYDASTGALGEKLAPYPPFRLEQDIKGDFNNIAPRLGFVYSLPDNRTVLRGGYGIYFGEVLDVATHWTQMTMQNLVPSLPNDGRPNFAADPFNGRIPTFETVRQQIPVLDLGGIGIIDPADFETPYAHQTSIGLERQLGETMAFQADYVFRGNRELLYRRDINVTYNPTTGAPIVNPRPIPGYGQVLIIRSGGYSNSHSLETAFTKRLSQRWQLSATYTLSWLKDQIAEQPFANAPADLYGAYGYGIGDQRHRAVINGIWTAPLGIQVSGLYFYGSGERRETSIGLNVRNISYGPFGSCCGGLPNRLRPDGSLVPRNGLVDDPAHRVDLRLQRGVSVAGNVRVEGIVEVFNLFNRANYTGYTTVEGNRLYGQPSGSDERTMQFGFRVTF